MLTVEHLSLTYEDGTVGLENVSFSLTQGETCALIGANGAGKTSLMMALVGIADFRGRIVAGGVESEKQNLPLLRQRVGLVFQNPDDQLFMPTIFQDVAFGLQNMGLPDDEVRRRTEGTLERLGILHLKDRSSLRLSGGEKRMAALATVLAMEPEVVLLDEPTAFLDPKARRRLIGVLKGLEQTMLVATHDLPFALEVCKRSIVLTEGRAFADGLSEELLFDEEKMDQGGVEAIRRYG
ncbi:MAG: ABC transporter ATP-binding protein [Oscillospiraceae bacterium]|nr:ABC transporter ATP-binding protein [Oscillospiraceae bacterium]